MPTRKSSGFHLICGSPRMSATSGSTSHFVRLISQTLSSFNDRPDVLVVAVVSRPRKPTPFVGLN